MHRRVGLNYLLSLWEFRLPSFLLCFFSVSVYTALGAAPLGYSSILFRHRFSDFVFNWADCWVLALFVWLGLDRLSLGFYVFYSSWSVLASDQNIIMSFPHRILGQLRSFHRRGCFIWPVRSFYHKIPINLLYFSKA